MSIRVMTAVFDYSRSTGSDRLVLLVIADRAHDDGTGCWRSKESIARMARVSRTTVTESIRRLEQLGELIVERRPGTTSLYRINLEGVRIPADLSGDDSGENPGEDKGDNPQGARIRPGVGQTGGRDTSISVSTSSFSTNTRDRPTPVSLGRTVDAPPLWELDPDTSEARWIGEGHAPTTTHNKYAGDYRGPR